MMKRTRISAHLADTPVEDGEVVVEGWLNYYDEEEKKWKPLKAKIDFYLDERRIGETTSNEVGKFEFSFPSPYIGRHKVEIRFKGRHDLEPSYKLIEFNVLRKEEKRRLTKIAKGLFILVLAVCAVSLIIVYLVKLIRS